MLSKILFYLGSFSACTVLAFNVGCASGGFKTTRSFAQLINGQHPAILRVILYILTAVVFAVTMLIDMIIFNTMDFWDGKVSAGEYNFKDGEKTYVVRHEFLPGTHLKRSTIHVNNDKNERLQEVILSELTSGEVEMYVDGKLRARVKDIHQLPVASIYDENGKLTSEKTLFPTLTARSANESAVF